MSIALSQLHSHDRVNLIEPGRLHPAVSFARASTATYMGPAGTLLTAAINTPRFEYYSSGNYSGFLPESAATNVLLNSTTLSTQNVTVTATARTLSFYGTGTITLSGAYAGSLVGTGSSNRVVLTFTPSAGTLTVTVSGSVNNAQLETGSQATSYVPTAGSAVTRAADVCKVNTLPAIGWNPSAGTFFIESNITALQTSGDTVIVGAGAMAHNPCRYNLTNVQALCYNTSPISLTLLSSAPSPGVQYRTVYAYAAANFGGCLNGGAVATNTSGGLPATAPTAMSIGSGGFFGHITRLTYYPGARRINADLARMTA